MALIDNPIAIQRCGESDPSQTVPRSHKAISWAPILHSTAENLSVSELVGGDLLQPGIQSAPAVMGAPPVAPPVTAPPVRIIHRHRRELWRRRKWRRRARFSRDWRDRPQSPVESPASPRSAYNDNPPVSPSRPNGPAASGGTIISEAPPAPVQMSVEPPVQMEF